MLRRTMLKGVAACGAVLGVLARPADAQEVLKMGISIPMTGAGFNAVGRQLAAAIKLYVEQHGDTIAGRKLEIILRDDAGVADNARRIVQEMIVNERVGLVGIGITPTSLSIAPLVTEARMPTLVLSSGASVTVTKSPYMVRAGFVIAQQSWIMAEWAAKNGSKRVVTLVNDWAPGVEAETAFRTRFIQAGGQIIEAISIPLANPDFAPFTAADTRRPIQMQPSFISPNPQAGCFCQTVRRARSGQLGQIIGAGDLTDDDTLNASGDQMIGMITAGSYSAAHDSTTNKAYVAAFETANKFRPNVVSLAGYDGMHLIYEALKRTDGRSDGDTLLAAMKGMTWESPRGPMTIDPQTRDVVNNIYIRKVEKINGQLYNTEFATFEAVHDPMKAGSK